LIRRLDRYMLKEMVGPFFLGCVLLVFMFQANDVMMIFKDYPQAKIPPLALLQWLGYRTPSFISLTLPAGIALASSLTMARLQRESELTALRSAGIPIRRVMLPVLMGGLIGAGINFYVVEILNPPAQKQAYKLQAEIVGLNLTNTTMVSNKPIKLPNGMMVYIQSLMKRPKDVLDLQRIVLVEWNGPDTIITASPSGQYRDGVWTLHDSVVRTFSNENTVTLQSKGDTVINEKIIVPDLFTVPKPDTLTIGELRKSISQLERTDATASELLDRKVNLYERYAIPLACLAFALTGSVLAIRFSRQGPMAGVIWSLLLVMLHFNAMVVCQKIIAPTGIVSPLIAAFLPDIIFFVAGLWMLRGLE